MRTYNYLRRSTVKKYLPDMQIRGVSERARQPNGFTSLYIQGMNPKTTMATKNQTWEVKRHNYIKRRLAQPHRLFDSKGVPSRWHLSLISWGYSPVSYIK